MSDSASLSSGSIASVLWFLKQKDQQTGPFTSQQLKEMATGGKLAPADQLQRLGDSKWVPASAVKGLFGPTKSPEKSGILPAANASDKSGVKPPAPKPDDKSGVKPPASKPGEKSDKSSTLPAPKSDDKKTTAPEKIKAKSDAGSKEAAKDKTPSPDKTLPVKKGKQSLVFEESEGLVKSKIDLKPGSRWPWIIAGSFLILLLGGLTFLAAQRLFSRSDRPPVAKNDPDKKGPEDGKKVEDPKEKEPVKKEEPKKEEPKKKEEKKPEPPMWRVVKHGPGRFSVDLPRSAEFFSDRGDDGREITVLRVEDDRDKDYFEVNFSTFAEKPADPKTILSKLAGKLDRENPKKKDLDLSGNPGTERIAEVQIEKVPVVIQQRTYIVGNRAYQVTAAKEKSKLVQADVDRFMNSFKLEK